MFNLLARVKQALATLAGRIEALGDTFAELDASVRETARLEAPAVPELPAPARGNGRAKAGKE